MKRSDGDGGLAFGEVEAEGGGGVGLVPGVGLEAEGVGHFVQGGGDAGGFDARGLCAFGWDAHGETRRGEGRAQRDLAAQYRAISLSFIQMRLS